MDSELLKILSEEIREAKNMVIENRRVPVEANSIAKLSQSRAELTWEFAVITRNKVEEELRYFRLPWWQRLISKYYGHRP